MDAASLPTPVTGSAVLPDYRPPSVQRLPTMDDLDALSAELDLIDRTLAELDA